MTIDRRDVGVAAGLIVAGFILLRPGYIVPDALATWSWLRSLIFDGDLLFFNEWAAFGRIRDGVPQFKEITPTGALANHWWIGSSLVAIVPYLLAHIAALAAPLPGAGGFGGVYAWSLAWLSVACLWGIWLAAAKTVDRGRYDLLCFICVIVGTPVLWYAFRFPTMSHLPGAAAVAVLVLSIRNLELDPRPRHEYAIGLALGAAAAIRLQHAMLLPAVITALVLLRRPLGGWLRVATGVIPFALLQGIAWYAVYGTPLGPLVSGVDPEGGTWAAFRNPAMLEALFSPWNGLFIWAPLVLVAMAGWFGEARAHRWNAVLPLVFIAMFAGQWIANGAMDRWWWGGLSFGPRRWVDLALPILVGLIWAARRWRYSIPLMLVCSAWSGLLLVAAASQSLDLSGPTSWSSLGLAVAGIEWPVALRTLLVPDFPGVAAFAAAVVGLGTIALYALLVLVFSRRRWLTATTAGVAIVMIVWILAVVVPTRERAGFFHQQFRIDGNRSDLGALTDRLDLMSRELRWLEQTEGARRDDVRRELVELDRQIRNRMRGATAPPGGAAPTANP